MKKTILGVFGMCLLTATASAQYNRLPKPPSGYTIQYNDSIRTEAHLDFNSKADSINANRGAMAIWPNLAIISASGDTVWNMRKFSFLNSAPTTNAPKSVNPSLWRQAKLNYLPGVFRLDNNHIYQVRGFDLSNITFIKGNTGWIVIDPLVTRETAKAALDSINKLVNPANKKVSAVIYTHSHIDHYGGILGIAGDMLTGAPIYGPSGFLEHAVSENTIAGNVMGRRAAYMYGSLYPRGEKHMVDAGLGKGISTGTSGLLSNTVSINQGILNPRQTIIDGVSVHFWCTPGAEAPVEMMFYFPDYKALCASEEVTHTMHNVYSLRGAKVRDALGWSKFIDSTLNYYGYRSEIIFASHHWPVWGTNNVQNLLAEQRDLYRYMHDQTMRMANQGYTALEISEKIQLPKSLDTVWANRGYYGTLNHNAKSVFDYYLGGWFDGNPANLHPLPPREESIKYVEFMGGIQQTLEKAKHSYDRGEYRWAATVLNHLVFADSGNMDARFLLADTYEQLGYQAESGPWRNFYLTGAEELRYNNLPYKKENKYPTNEVMNQMPLDQYLDFLAIHLVAERAGNRKFSFQVEWTDPNAEKLKMIIYLTNSTVNYRILPRTDAIAEQGDAQIKLPRDVMNTIINYGPQKGKAAMTKAVNSGAAMITGAHPEYWYLFIDMLDEYEFWFNIVLP